MNTAVESEENLTGQTAKQCWWLFLLLGLALIRGMIYAAVVPPWQAPDETGHFEYAWLIAHLGRLPTQEDLDPHFEQEMIASLYEWHYGAFLGRSLPGQMPARMELLPAYTSVRSTRTVLAERFSLAYLWQALFLLPFREQDLMLQLFVMRLSSVLLNVGIVWLAFLTFGELFSDRPDLAVLATVIILFLPQHTFINGSVSDGTMAEAMGGLVLYSWVTLFRHGARAWRFLGIVLGTLLGLWSKNTAVYLIPVDICLGAWWLVRQRRRPWTWRHLAYVCACIALLGAGLLIWSYSPLGQRASPWLKAFPAPSKWTWVDQRGMTFGQALLATYDSLWATFGWMSLPISARWYGAIALLSALALWGWCAERRQEPQAQPRWSVGMMGGILVAALLVFLWIGLLSQPDYYQYQGRYLFPALIPFLFMLVGGLDRLLQLRSNRATLFMVVLFMVVLDSWCLFGVIIPYYYA